MQFASPPSGLTCRVSQRRLRWEPARNPASAVFHGRSRSLVSQGLSSTSPFESLRRHSRLRLVATLLCLLASTLQAFVAQTHVHAQFSRAAGSAAYSVDVDSVAAPSDPASSKHNGRDGTSSCPLCQIVAHGGAAPAPAFALSLPLPTAIAVAQYEQQPSAIRVAVSFNWQGRAPPLA